MYRYYLGNISSNFLWTSNYKRFKSLTKKKYKRNIEALINILTIIQLRLPCTETHMSTKVFKFSPEYSIPSVRRHHQFWHTLQSVEWFSQDALQICGLLDDYNIQKTRGSTRGNKKWRGRERGNTMSGRQGTPNPGYQMHEIYRYIEATKFSCEKFFLPQWAHTLDVCSCCWMGFVFLQFRD